MTIRQLFILLSTVAVSLNGFAGAVEVESANNASTRCDTVRSADFTGLPDASTRVVETKFVDASGDAAGYCRVDGVISPSIGLVIRMPLNGWNGKFLQLGCGGQCGTTEDSQQQCDGALSRGYACVVSDRGHKGSSVIDTSWAHKDMEGNLQSLMDTWDRSTHVTAIAGKAIVQRFYGQQPRKSYFMGCSAGGKAAMREAQSFPWDFDGIVAGGPALRATKVAALWNVRVFNDANGTPLLGKNDLAVLHREVVEKCDLNDGIKDGLIGDPRRCDFKPEDLLCAVHKTSDCLTARQVDAVRKIYAGPATSTGNPIEHSSAMKGSELQWDWFIGDGGNYFKEIFRYFLFQKDPGPNWSPTDFDFDRDYKRLGLANVFMDEVNPDLRRFESAGGKLLMYTGWDDTVEGVLDTVDYYEAVERTIGGRAATQDFYRLFVIPGMNHCTGGNGPFSVDYLTYLELWVEKDQAPSKIIGNHLPDVKDFFGLIPPDPEKIEFSRPIYPYPMRTEYLGRGDPKLATSFGPVQP